MQFSASSSYFSGISPAPFALPGLGSAEGVRNAQRPSYPNAEIQSIAQANFASVPVVYGEGLPAIDEEQPGLYPDLEIQSVAQANFNPASASYREDQVVFHPDLEEDLEAQTTTQARAPTIANLRQNQPEPSAPDLEAPVQANPRDVPAPARAQADPINAPARAVDRPARTSKTGIAAIAAVTCCCTGLIGLAGTVVIWGPGVGLWVEGHNQDNSGIETAGRIMTYVGLCTAGSVALMGCCRIGLAALLENAEHD